MKRHLDFTVNGIRLHVVEDGPSNGPLVLLLHGFPEFWYAWHHQVAPLAAAGFRIWMPDQRGYGKSDRPRRVRAYRVEELVADVAELIYAAGATRAAAVVGHDWGGIVAWALAQRHPDRLDRLVILNAPHPAVMRHHLQTSPSQMLRSWYAAAFQVPLLPELILGLRDGAVLARALRRTSRSGTFPDHELAHYREAWRGPGVLRAMIHWYRAAARLRHYPAAGPRIRVPTLLLWGSRDRFLERTLAHESIAQCDRGRLSFLDHATHWLHHEDPERVNAEILRFLAESPSD